MVEFHLKHFKMFWLEKDIGVKLYLLIKLCNLDH